MLPVLGDLLVWPITCMYFFFLLAGPERDMTKEDVPESSQGDSVQDRHQNLSCNLDRPVVHQVASAPMPLDCGENAETLMKEDSRST